MEKFDLQRRNLGKWARSRFARELVKNRIWFVDIPRTSSTSVKTKLGQLYGSAYGKCYDRQNARKSGTVLVDHTPASKVIRVIGRENWDQLYTFSFVRNPWARFYSLYRFRIADGVLPATLEFNTYVQKLDEFRFRDRHSPFSRHEYHYPMLDYLMDDSEQLLVTECFKVEERSQAIIRIQEQTGVDLNTDSKEVLCSPDEYRDFYSAESREIVGRFYKDDIQYFNYAF